MILNQNIIENRLFLEIECDECHQVFSKSFRAGSKHSENYCKKKYHFDTKECSFASRKSGGLVYENYRQTLMTRYGFDNPSKVQEFKEKRVATTLERFGVEYWFQRIDLREEKMLEAYGVTNPLKDVGIRQQVSETCMQRYGVTNAYLKPEVFTKAHTSDAMEKGLQTKIKKGSYEAACKKANETIVANGGYDNIVKKRRATMKSNGTHLSSKPEEICYKLLVTLFGNDDIERQVSLNNWSIDFRIRSNDVYVQIDGVYWHAKGKFLDKVLASKSKQAKVILQTVERDIKQCKWALQNNIKMLRITDVAVKNITSDELRRQIELVHEQKLVEINNETMTVCLDDNTGV